VNNVQAAVLVGVMLGLAIAITYIGIRLMNRKRWCEQCQRYGHSKWLFLGNHKTHRMYLRYKIRQARKRALR
jgi:hypothetical protein